MPVSFESLAWEPCILKHPHNWDSAWEHAQSRPRKQYAKPGHINGYNLIDIETGVKTWYKVARRAAEFMNVPRSTMTSAIASGSVIRGKWRIEYA